MLSCPLRVSCAGHDDQVGGFVDHVNRSTHGALITCGQAQAEVWCEGLTSCERIP